MSSEGKSKNTQSELVNMPRIKKNEKTRRNLQNRPKEDKWREKSKKSRKRRLKNSVSKKSVRLPSSKLNKSAFLKIVLVRFNWQKREQGKKQLISQPKISPKKRSLIRP